MGGIGLALERHSIEKKDFPLGRRGYDPAAVDAHLSTIADDVEALQQGRGHSSEPVAVTISEQVRGIVEAAEKGAAEIHARAQQEAREIKAEATRAAKRERQHADRDAKREREQAAQQAREYVGQVSQSTSQMLERLQTIDGELSGLTESLRAGTARLAEELGRLEGELETLSAATASGLESDEEPDLEEPVAPASPSETAPAVAEAAPVPPAEAVPATEAAKVGDRPPEEIDEPEPVEAGDALAATEPEPPSEHEPEEGSGGGDDSEGARLIALNMALNGTPRDETDRYLAENFTLHNRELLLNEVYASVGD
jgi:DivIVA domain-containing protein